MPLYEIDAPGSLIPVRRLRGGPDLYERELEELLWANHEEILGEALLLIARQPTVSGGGRPDLVALDVDGRVVVIEVKRDVERGQLAQCLEYAGWARTTNLDELARMYHWGVSQFFVDWQQFTGTDTPRVVNQRPRLFLVARGAHGRTQSALEFLIENGLPVKMIGVSVYEDQNGRRFVDTEAEYEPEILVLPDDRPNEVLDHTRIDGRRVRLTDLLEADLIQPGDELVWERPRLGVTYRARVTENGAIELDDGQRFSSPSSAAKIAAGVAAMDGWQVWKVARLDGKLINDLRLELAAARQG